MQYFPTKAQLIKNFSICNNWEEKYIYIMELGRLLPKFPNNLKQQKYQISGCQNKTWIALILTKQNNRIQDTAIQNTPSIKLYGDSDSAIVKGIIAIIFNLYKGRNLEEIIHVDVTTFLINQLQLKQNLTISRSQGIFLILRSIHSQADELLHQKIYSSNIKAILKII
ncbi:SufE family protein [Candidatus Blochmannia ocreatus (nom. nud.)]|uniref:SufE family protein n=1 Tax=Candidatus Blochmannia ocreatus (nom. nud.) TaxID=251538 RepID=A0ABY4SSA9_9ENTR|nr:SufE family protein [Candidatus Blochmannia ocreatus]URJ24872.1 SufE family protein [Candidatus Blochmannia ocreatus]